MKEFNIEELKANRFRTLKEVCKLLNLDIKGRRNLDSIVDVKYIFGLIEPIVYVNNLTEVKDTKPTKSSRRKSFNVKKETRDSNNGE